MIFSPDKHDQKIIKLLQTSKQDFEFGQEIVKHRLMESMDRVPKAKQFYHNRFLQVAFLKYTLTTAIILAFLTSTFAFASNAQPGDTFFPVSKFSERVILSLPLTVEEKARVHMMIVGKRLKALEQSEQPQNKTTSQVQLQIVKESDDSISEAIQSVAHAKQQMKSHGDSKGEQKMTQALQQLQNMASTNEQNIQTIQTQSQNQDQQTQNEMQHHLENVQNARHKASNMLNSANPNVQGSTTTNNSQQEQQQQSQGQQDGQKTESHD